MSSWQIFARANLIYVALGLTLVGCEASLSQTSAPLKHVEELTRQGHGDFSTAREELKILLKKYPQDIDVHLAAARFYKTIGLVGQSQAEYKRAIELGCKKSEPFIALADICQANLDNKQAMAYASKALALEPDSPQAHKVLISALLNEGKLKEAKELLFPKKSGGNKNLTDPDLCYLAYRLYNQGRQLSLARTYLDDAIKLKKPEQPRWLLDRADLYRSLGDESNNLSDKTKDYEEARRTLEDFLDNNEPKSIEGRLKLGTILEFYDHDFDSAMNQYKMILETDPENVHAITGLERCKKGKNDLAGQMKLEFWKTISQPFNALRDGFVPKRSLD
jgi:tetratricopeptide (TPR) repeat protein